MAGSIFGLGMSQRVDSNGKPAVGWLLYIYAANSSTPSQIWQDVALTIPATWPLAADANGMMPPFWLADGSYRVRGTTADGSTTYFDIQSALALGASSGSAPSGGVDPTTIFQTGDQLWIGVAGTRSGWVRDNGRTIGSATSGATERANADAQALFEFIWNTYADAQCPVVGGRGGSALSDWTANKQITLLDMRGCIPGGLDDMGNGAAGRWSGAPVVSGNATTGGAILGENTHTLSTGEMPAHNHTGSTATDSGHTHTLTGQNASGVMKNTGNAQGAPGPGGACVSAPGGVTATDSGSASISLTIASQGGGAAHNVAQRTVLGTFYRKL